MIAIHSSWGTITCNDKGDVLEKDLCDIDEPCYLNSATRFDVDEFDKWYESFTGKPSQKPPEFDVLEVGFWNQDGCYIPADKQWRKDLYK